MYRLIYDARQIAIPDLTISLALAMAAVVGVAFWLYGRQDVKRWAGLSMADGRPGPAPAPGIADPLQRAWRMRRIGRGVALVTIPLAAFSTCAQIDTHARFRRALEQGDYTLVEGRVTDFVRGDRGGHRYEQFSVRSGGRVYTYRYNHAVGVQGWHESHGPIFAGLRVRIADVDGAIARLEVADEYRGP